MAQVGRNMRLEEMLEECATMSLSEEKEEFSGWEISTVFFYQGCQDTPASWLRGRPTQRWSSSRSSTWRRASRTTRGRTRSWSTLETWSVAIFVILNCFSQTCRCRISRSPVSTKSWARSIYSRQQTSDVLL